MAKDKSKSKGAGDEFAKPSEAPATGDGWRFESDENIGRLFILTPLREEDFTSEEWGTSKIVVADIVEVNERKLAKSVEHPGSFVFGGWTKGSLRGFIGERRVLARLGKGKAEGKKSAAWLLEDATDEDIAIGKAYLASVDPFAPKGGKDDDDEGEAPKAKKKKAKA